MSLHEATDAAVADEAAAAAPNAADQVPHDRFIAGRRWQPAAGGTMTVLNPATEAVIAGVADADRTDRTAPTRPIGPDPV